MKFKKMLSLMAATAIAAGSLAAIAITADAAELSGLTPIPTSVTVLQAADYSATSGAQDLTPDGYFIGGKSGILMGTKKYNYGGENINRQCFNIKSATADITQAKVIAFKPAAACTITAYGQYDSGKTNGRGFNIVTDKATGTSEPTDGTNIATVAYDGTGYVYLTSTDSSIDAYVGTITFAWSSSGQGGEPTEAPETTEAPAEPDTLIPVNEAKTWTQADFEIGAYTATVLSSDKTLAINGADSKAINVDQNAIKLGGTGSAAERNVSFIPAADGVVKVTAINGNASATDRRFAISVDGTETASELIIETNSVELTVAVKANKPVYIYSKKSGVNLISIAYTVGVPELEINTTVDPEKASAFTKADGYDKDMVVGIVELSVKNGFIDLNSASYEGNAPTEVAGDNAANFSGTALVTIVINGATSTEALEHVIFN